MAKKITAKEIFRIVKSAGKDFIDKNSMMLSAALAFYTMFSLPPLLILIISIAGALIGEEEVSETLFNELEDVFGQDGAVMVQSMLESFRQDETGWAGTAIWIGILVFTSTTFFVTMQDSLNTIWGVRADPDNAFMKLVRDRILSFGLILSTAFLLLVSFVLSAGLVMLGDYLQGLLPEVTVVVMTVLGFIVTILTTTLLFSLIFKYLPDTEVRWKDIWVGALITAILFEGGRYLIGVYISQSEIASAYGTAGSVVVILIWVQYSSLILFFGASLTKQYTYAFGGWVLPQDHAKKVTLAEKEVDERKNLDHALGRPPADGRFRKK